MLLDEPWPGRISIGSHGYPQVCPRGTGRVVLLHRLVLGLEKGDRRIGDHINRRPLDCRRVNLRIVDGSTSNANREPHERVGASVFRTRSGMYVARFRWRREEHYLGTFADELSARTAIREYRAEHCADSIPPGMVS